MVIFISSVILVAGIVQVYSGAVDNGTAVYVELFQNYSASTLPLCESGSTMQVKVGIALRQILEMNEPAQILQTTIWLRLSWTDCRLVWDATLTGVSSLVIPVKEVWTPDVTLYDNAENSLGGSGDYRASVYPDGSVYYYFPSVISTFCKIDVTYFPFDTQTCPLKFGSWSYHGNELNFTRRDGETSADISAYKENGEWEIDSAPAVRHELYYGCCTDPYPDVTFYIKLKRRSQFYLMNLIFPCVLMSSMAVLGFVLPPDSGEKVSLEITVLLSLSVFMLMVSEIMPPTSETFPFIGIYFACAMGLVSWSCLMTVTVLNVHYRGGRGQRMPSWVRTVFFDWVGWLLCVTSYKNIKSNKINAANTISDELKLTDAKSKIHDDKSSLHENQEVPTIPWNKISRRESIFTGDDRRVHEVKILQQQLECMGRLQNIFEGQKETYEIGEEWQILAQILDRAFMIIFFVVQFIATLVVMVKITSYD